MNLALQSPVSALGRIGSTTASRLKRLGIETISDLIFYYPFRWEDLSLISDIIDVKPEETFTIKGRLQLIKSRRSPVKKRMLTEGLVVDKTGSIKVIWFNQPYLSKVLVEGDEVYLSGKVSFDKYTLQLINPVYEKVRTEKATHTARIVPVYSLTSNLTQKQIRFLIKQSLGVIDFVREFLPDDVIDEYQLVSLGKALQQIHFPENKKELDEAINRLKFDELFLFQLQAQLSKLDLVSSLAEAINFSEEEIKFFVQSLPFKLTNDQKKAAWQIITDLKRNRPMNRLLEGEVGSGKTVVATMAMYNTALADKQSVIMAPTEILAAQHYRTITELLSNTDIKFALVTRSQQLIGKTETTKKKILEKISSGEVKIVIGTHSLIQESVLFASLALVVVDEQHRFGVGQRKLLQEKSGSPESIPHLLSMTATPIPRSLALTMYGDLDLSVIRELPKERKKIITKIISPKEREDTYQFIKEQVAEGRQIFVICPLIDPSDKLGVKAVTDEYKILNTQIFPDLTIGMLHGKLKPKNKESVMKEFLSKLSDILVSTSVVEVGVDVPNATVMVIEGAERFGLAQLHQFRGRVGRSNYQSYCFLFSENKNQKTKERLAALVSAKDGFELAEYDLKFRGPGEVYGVKQSGWLDFKIAKFSDYKIIEKAKTAAEKLIEEHPDLKDYPELKIKIDNFLQNLHLE
ncbi:MAG: ATP-dependent DNA helicase RecG [Parcubacteria group bacterium]|nr:ATP-dependent DNA helicase RecG [Parcubacteria group bacterium]|tara:strand:+ start:3234 stop:5306 length:2073 start_codon:yes stop_codon:yes gene_type:complete